MDPPPVAAEDDEKGATAGMTKIWLWVGVALGAFFLFANVGFHDFVLRTREKWRIEKRLGQLRADHQALAKEWTQIQQDPSYTEYLIRKTLGYVKKGEIEYQILKPKEKS